MPRARVSLPGTGHVAHPIHRSPPRHAPTPVPAYPSPALCAAGRGPWTAYRPDRRRRPPAGDPAWRRLSRRHHRSTRPQRQGFGGVCERHHVGTFERSHRAGDPRHLVQSAGAESAGAQLGGQEVGGVLGHLRRAVAMLPPRRAPRPRGERPARCTHLACPRGARRDPAGSAARRDRSGRARVPRSAAGSGHGRRCCSCTRPRTPPPHRDTDSWRPPGGSRRGTSRSRRRGSPE